MSQATQAPILVNGTCDPRFAAVREEFERNFRERAEVGAAVCVYQDGTKVVACGAATKTSSARCRGPRTRS